ncbi:MAG2810 family protein [Mycoplasmopsis felifaucium]|uniref:MAG2810 family protein n=1 Tax=Mycoplasmopsis felifaucium TaxID=35768 RepID=UPI00068CE0D0|nr:hypothetical protein [Mycoplasmopsis felifaucium]
MNNYNLILSKDKFREQQYTTIKNATESKINTFFKQKENAKRLSFATVGFLTTLILFIVGVALLLSTVSLNIYTTLGLKKGNWLFDNSKPFFWTMYSISLAISLICGVCYVIAKRERISLKRDVILSFNGRNIIDYLFKYIGLNPKYDFNEMGAKIINYSPINFYKNTSNFADLANYNLVLGKYELYEATTKNQYFKLQNLLYHDNSWVDISSVDNKTFKKIMKYNANVYKSRVELDENVRRFGIAAKILNINKDFNITLFDANNNYSSAELFKIELDKQFDSIVLNAKRNVLLSEWLEDENNLKYLKELHEFITSINIYNPAKKQHIKKNSIKSLSLVLRNQEAFIWFDTNCELFDLAFSSYTLKAPEIVDIITNKIIDDFYLVYLLIQLLAPFGLDVTLKIDEKKVNDANELKTSDNDSEL